MFIAELSDAHDANQNFVDTPRSNVKKRLFHAEPGVAGFLLFLWDEFTCGICDDASLLLWSATYDLSPSSQIALYYHICHFINNKIKVRSIKHEK